MEGSGGVHARAEFEFSKRGKGGAARTRGGAGTSREKTSSEVMQSSRAPGMLGYCGRPPTAMRIRRAVMTVSFPFSVAGCSHLMVWLSTKEPLALMYSTLALRRPLM